VLGEEFELERRGTHGDLALFEREMLANDGKVDVLCVGGTNLGLHWNGRYYPFVEIERIMRKVKHTPIADGAGVKNTLERETVRLLDEQGVIDFATAKIFMVCALDRFGMAEAIAARTKQFVLGDLMMNLGAPLPVRTLRGMNLVAALILPLFRRLPFKWLYPTGEKEDVITPKYEKYYQWADVIAGDFLLIRKHLPDDLTGKIVLTNTTNARDVEELRQRGVRLLITATPVVDGRSFGTNVLEGVFVSLLGKPPAEIKPEEYLELAHRMGWAPTIRDLTVAAPQESE
jgi:hypothetical protein